MAISHIKILYRFDSICERGNCDEDNGYVCAYAYGTELDWFQFGLVIVVIIIS